VSAGGFRHQSGEGRREAEMIIEVEFRTPQKHADKRGHGDKPRPQRRPALTVAVSPYLAAFELHVFVLRISKCIVGITGTNR
jgi:hypothetical protein